MTISIPIHGAGGTSCVALVDDVDRCLAEAKWYRPRTGRYAMRSVYLGRVNGRPRATSESLHRKVMERVLGRAIAPGMVCDHINGDPLDCRRSNLRETTTEVNNQNLQRAFKTSATGLLNVQPCTRGNGYQARVYLRGVVSRGPIRNTPEEASHDAAAIRLRLGLQVGPSKLPAVKCPTVYQDGQRLHPKNKTGHRGVVSYPGGRWLVQVRTGSKKYHGGIFTSLEAAAKAAHALRVKVGIAE